MKLNRILLLLFSCILVADSLNIVVYILLVGKSHLQFISTLADKLVARGHNVDFIITRFNSDVQSNGTKSARRVVSVEWPGGVSPWNSGADHLTDPFEESISWNPFKRPFALFVEINDKFCDVVLDSPDVDHLLRNNKYDIALINSYDFCGYALAHHYGIESVVSFAATPSSKLSVVHSGMPELPIYENMIIDVHPFLDRNYFFSRVFETIRSLTDAYNHYIGIEETNRKFRAKFGADFPDVRDLAADSALDFTNANPLLDEPRPLPPKVHYIGGVGLPKPKNLPEELDRILDISKRGTVIFSFGTQVPAKNIPRWFIDNFAAAAQSFPEFTFLWKLDSHAKVNATNVFTTDWLPQTDLLYDHRVVGFISHMGLNSFTEAAYAGVPVLCIPLFADQMHNSRRAVSLGTGVVLRKSELTTANLREALRKILHEPSFMNRAHEIASILKNNPNDPERIFVEGVEYAAMHKNIHLHLTPSGARQPYLVALGWDVVIFLSFVAMLSAIILFSISIVIFRFLKGVVRIQKMKVD